MDTPNDDRSAVAWLHRRAGWGLAPGELDELAALGPAAALDRLIDPDAHGVPAAPDPWAALGDVALLPEDGPAAGDARRQAIGAWLTAMVGTARPLEERMRWLWHGHLVSGLNGVPHVGMMIEQLRTWQRLGLGDVPTLLRAATVDAAMLRYLDGAASRRDAVNENYGRELLELFALGIGAYDEHDVRAAAVALTGWVVVPGTITTAFVDRRHDPTPQRLLGVSGVDDVDSVIAAVVAQPACARHLTAAIAAELLGPGVDEGLLDEHAERFAADGLAIRPLVRALLAAGLDGAATPMVLPPVPWLVQAMRSLALTPTDVFAVPEAVDLLVGAGQVPMLPPNVSGWPSGRAWLTTAGTLARVNLSSVLATLVPDGAPARAAAAAGDVAALADLLGRPEGFGSATVTAVRDAGTAGGRHGATLALATALAAPEMVIA